MRILLHAGWPKTGTTAIQEFLAAYRDTLAQQGVFYPGTEFPPSHNVLATPFRTEMPRQYRHQHQGSFAELQDQSIARWELIADEFRRANHHTLLISGEQFSDITEHEAFRRRMREWFGNDVPLTTVFYLRQPSRQYASQLQQSLRANHILLKRFTTPYSARIRMWAAIGDIDLREFHPETLINQDIVADFCARYLPSVQVGTDAKIEANKSLSSEGMQLLQTFRRDILPDRIDVFDPSSETLIRTIEACERASETGYTRPKIFDDLAACIDRHPETQSLADDLNFRFRDLGDLGIDPEGKLPDRYLAAENVSDVMEVNPRKLERLTSEVIQRLMG